MTAQEHIAYVGLGSNLDAPASQVQRAFAALERLPCTRLLDRSSLYGSRPFGPIAQPDFVNAAAKLQTGLAPQALLAELQRLEVELGREPGGQRWGPRRIDIDLLLYDALRMETGALCLPHPGIVERNFVLYPLLELSPDLLVPGLGPIAALAARVDRTGLRRLENETAHGA